MIRPSRYSILAILACFAITFIGFYISDGLIEPGDGVMHYQMAKWSWTHPHLLMDHWGKPLFTTLSSPFAQLGYVGMVIFNFLCFVISGFFFHSIAKKLDLKESWLGILIMFCAPVYGAMVMAGMTEILFATILLGTLYFFIHEKYHLGALLFGFSLFSRPEGQVLIPLIGLYLLLQNWRSLPFLLIGTAVFALIGGIVLGDFLWYFNTEPYKWDNNIYGSGDFWVFVKGVKNIFGLVITFLFLLSVIAFVLTKKYRELNRKALLFWGLLVIGSMTLVWFVHSFLWWKGLKGSFGLSRVLATIAPLVALVCLYGYNITHSKLVERFRWMTYVPLLIALAVVAVFVERTQLPTEERPEYKTLEKAIDGVSTQLEGQKVHYLDPWVGYYLGLDPFDKNRAALLWGIPDGGLSERMEQGEILIWESHYAATEGKLTLDEVFENKDLKLLYSARPDSVLKVMGKDYEVHVFEFDQE